MRLVQETGEEVFRLSFSIDRSSRKSRFSIDISSRKSQVFRLDPPVGKLSRKKLSRKRPFSTV